MKNQEVRRMLFADDDPMMRECFETLWFPSLNEARLTAALACDVPTAAKKIAEGPAFDLIVSDYDMPGTNGLEFFKSLIEKTPGVVFVLFSAHVGDIGELEELTTKYPNNLHVCVDKDWRRLKEMVLRLLGKERA